jgi:hypothetical protein
MKNIDLDALNADVQMAQQTGRKFCSVAVGELTSLLMRAAELKKIQGMAPIRIGWCCPEDVHKMLQGELHQVGLRRKKGSKYRIEAFAQSLPDGQRRAERPKTNELPEGKE